MEPSKLEQLKDQRRRAAHQATTGNYWAGKCVALIDEVLRIDTAMMGAIDFWQGVSEYEVAMRDRLAAMILRFSQGWVIAARETDNYRLWWLKSTMTPPLWEELSVEDSDVYNEIREASLLPRD